MKTPEEIAREVLLASGMSDAWPVLRKAIVAAIQSERDHWIAESKLPRVEEVQRAFSEANLTTRIAELEKALEPFAEIWISYSSACKQAEAVPLDEVRFKVLAGHCRRAAELLEASDSVSDVTKENV